jgi:acetate kinase
MAGSLVLVANPGSASRKYALFDAGNERAQLHFEWLNDKVICTLSIGGEVQSVVVDVEVLEYTTGQVGGILKMYDLLGEDEEITRIGLRVVAPGAYFLEDHEITDDFIQRLEAAEQQAPLHIAATLTELRALRQEFSSATIVGVSDSNFHITKPDYAWNYGISLELADQFDIKRFGYHGISATSVVAALHQRRPIPSRLIICHLGSGASVTAVHRGKSADTTMGYSPLEGVIMSTRSGSIDFAAARTIKNVSGFTDESLEEYLNTQSGLLGLGGSGDIRELLRREQEGDNQARLALATYVHSVQKSIGQMTAVLGGVDALVFTGTVGERSAAIRSRVATKLHYLGLVLDEAANVTCDSPTEPTDIGHKSSRPIYVVATREDVEIARRAAA